MAEPKLANPDLVEQTMPTSLGQGSSGTTAKTTAGGGVAVTLIAANSAVVYSHLEIHNEGAAAGWFSYDGGTTWHRLPADSVVTRDALRIDNVAVTIKDDAASALGGVYGSAW